MKTTRMLLQNVEIWFDLVNIDRLGDSSNLKVLDFETIGISK